MTAPNENQSFEKLVREFTPQSKLLRTWPLKGGISAEMTAFEVESPGGTTRRMILRRPADAALKRNPRAAQDEFAVLQMMHSMGMATPIPYYLDQSGKIFSTSYLVIGYIDGRPEFSPRHMDVFISQAAAQLARIHSLDRANLDFSFLPKPKEGLTDRYGQRPVKEDQSLDERRIRETLEAAWPFSRLNTQVLLHGDYWPGNLLWQGDQLAAVIDWEDAFLGDPLTDLAISRLDFLWIFGVDAMESFTEQYLARMEIDVTDLPYWDLCAALRLIRMAGSDLARWAAFFQPYGRQDITETTIRGYYRFFIKQAFDKLGN